MNENHHNRRRDDDMGFLRRNIKLLIFAGSFVAGYAILGWSVRDHHDKDDERDQEHALVLAKNCEDIAVLKEAIATIKENQKEQTLALKEILRRVK